VVIKSIDSASRYKRYQIDGKGDDTAGNVWWLELLMCVYLFAVAAALMAGFGAWAASTTQTRVAAPTGVRIDPSQMMMNAKDLPTQRVVDFSVIFN
jgi:hypothetical protein